MNSSHQVLFIQPTYVSHYCYIRPFFMVLVYANRMLIKFDFSFSIFSNLRGVLGIYLEYYPIFIILYWV